LHFLANAAICLLRHSDIDCLSTLLHFPPIEASIKHHDQNRREAVMAKSNDDTRDASLRVSKKMRDALKAAAATAGRPLYDVTNEAINNYLGSAKAGGVRKGKK
jgi:hypothetical protein